MVDGVLYSIRSGQTIPGQHLVEGDLTRQLGVSCGSLREGDPRPAGNAPRSGLSDQPRLSTVTQAMPSSTP